MGYYLRGTCSQHGTVYSLTAAEVLTHGMYTLRLSGSMRGSLYDSRNVRLVFPAVLQALQVVHNNLVIHAVGSKQGSMRVCVLRCTWDTSDTHASSDVQQDTWHPVRSPALLAVQSWFVCSP